MKLKMMAIPCQLCMNTRVGELLREGDLLCGSGQYCAYPPSAQRTREVHTILQHMREILITALGTHWTTPVITMYIYLNVTIEH